MKPTHDPQVLAARLHLRPHLIRLLDGIDMPETLRGQVADALLDAGDISRDRRPDVATVDGQPVPVLVHEATLTIRNPYPGVGEPVRDQLAPDRTLGGRPGFRAVRAGGEPMSDHPSGPALVRVVLERLGAGHSYDGGVNGTCYQCPFASGPLDSNGHPARWEEISNDPTEAYFRCHLPGRPNEVEWGEYAPCSQDEWVKAGLEALGGALGIGDCVRFDDGTASRELVVTNQPEIQSDGTVTFTVADPDAHERTERLRELLGHSEEATR